MVLRHSLEKNQFRRCYFARRKKRQENEQWLQDAGAPLVVEDKERQVIFLGWAARGEVEAYGLLK